MTSRHVAARKHGRVGRSSICSRPSGVRSTSAVATLRPRAQEVHETMPRQIGQGLVGFFLRTWKVVCDTPKSDIGYRLPWTEQVRTHARLNCIKQRHRAMEEAADDPHKHGRRAAYRRKVERP
jgi:hypothetical protein